MTVIKGAGGIVINTKGEVVLVNNLRGRWGFPKGHVEQGEDDLTAAKREILEESGVQDLTLIRELGLIKRKKKNKQIKMYLFTSNQKDLTPLDPRNPEAKWIDKKSALKQISIEEDKEFLLNVMEHI